jgi:hypothetical protein
MFVAETLELLENAAKLPSLIRVNTSLVGVPLSPMVVLLLPMMAVPVGAIFTAAAVGAKNEKRPAADSVTAFLITAGHGATGGDWRDSFPRVAFADEM